MARPVPDRRTALAAMAGLGALAALSGCAKGEGGEDVSASEDLMREHGILRRVLVLYRESAGLIRSGTAVDAAALAEAAQLFRAFGEDYHEHKLEEERVFPRVRRAGGPAAALVDTLVAQHGRGREINAYVIERCKGGKVAGGDAEPLSRALENFARMYEPHAAIEDTIVFQAWKKALSKHEFAEATEEFETIEKAQFKGDGFDIAAGQIAAIERRLGLADLARYTAPPLG